MQNFRRVFENVEDVIVIESEIADCQGELADEERKSVQNAVAKRIQEFIAGRTLARIALGLIGVPPAPIPVTVDRLPIWPDGLIGSISHADTLVGVAVAKKGSYQGLGFDIEVCRDLPTDVRRIVLSRYEEELLGAEISGEEIATIFSCKEAVYKAIYPITKETLGFQDVNIELHDGSFAARIDDASISSGLVVKGTGYCDGDDRFMRSLFVI